MGKGCVMAVREGVSGVYQCGGWDWETDLPRFEKWVGVIFLARK